MPNLVDELGVVVRDPADKLAREHLWLEAVFNREFERVEDRLSGCPGLCLVR